MFTAVTEMLTFVAFANIVQLYLFSVIISFFLLFASSSQQNSLFLRTSSIFSATQ